MNSEGSIIVGSISNSIGSSALVEEFFHRCTRSSDIYNGENSILRQNDRGTNQAPCNGRRGYTRCITCQSYIITLFNKCWHWWDWNLWWIWKCSMHKKLVSKWLKKAIKYRCHLLYQRTAPLAQFYRKRTKIGDLRCVGLDGLTRATQSYLFKIFQ